MSDIPKLIAAIDSRLAELAVEITALETASGARRAAHHRPIVCRRQRRDDSTLA